MQFITSHSSDIIAALTGIVAVASAVNAMWGKPDNKYLAYAHTAITWLALNWGNAANKDSAPTDAPKS